MEVETTISEELDISYASLSSFKQYHIVQKAIVEVAIITLIDYQYGKLDRSRPPPPPCRMGVDHT